MTPNSPNLESLLATLGQAQREGAFSAPAGRYPWQVAAARNAHKQAGRFGWVRVAIPLAAAAAVAVLFVGPSLMKSRSGRELAKSSPIALPSETAQHMADAGKSTSNAATFDCDYNGDGKVDGLDIQAFVNRRNDTAGDPALQAEFLQKCLLER
jgi:hypothetical protein